MKQHYPCQSWARRAFLFLLVLTLKTQAASSSMIDDTSGITLHVVNQPIENIFKLIEKQTGLTFYYGRSILDGTKPATVNVTKASLAEVMEVLLKGKNVSWKVKDKGVVLSKGEPAPEKASTGLIGDTVPRINVSGVVVDARGNALPGTSVSLRGQPRGQGTDANGRFSFVNVPSNGVLVFSSLGFDTKQVRIGGKTELRVTLDSLIREIKGVEIISTGYQNLSAEKMNGSYVQLDNALINRSVSTGIMDRIMNVTNSLRSSKNETTIRGYGTISASTEPLVVVDGFPYQEGANATTIINNLNPNDVESITVLRDAAAASIWGARSGNGVIVITTKRGSFNRKLNVQFNSNVNIIEAPRLNKLRLMSSADAVEYDRMQFSKGFYDMNDDVFPSLDFFPVVPGAAEVLLAQRRGDITSAQAEAMLNEYKNHDVRDDLSKYLLRDAVNQQYNVNISGGSDKISYYGSVGYDKNISDIVGNSNDRITLKVDNTFKPVRIAELRTFIYYTQGSSKNNGIDYRSFIADGNSLATSPYAFLADAQGNPMHVITPIGYRTPFVDTVSYPGLLDWHYRPLDELRIMDNSVKDASTRLGGQLKITLLDGLDVQFSGQYENRNGYNSRNHSQESYMVRDLINSFMYVAPDGSIKYPIPLGGILESTSSRGTAWNTRTQLNYNKTIGLHDINALAGYETGEIKTEITSDRKYGYNPDNGLTTENIDYVTSFLRRPSGGGPGTIPTAGPNSSHLNRTISYYGIAGYIYDGKYSAGVSGRIDASNYLGAKANQRSIPLWSASLGWTISRESFYSLSTVPILKLRASYGYTGNLNNKATPLATAGYNFPNGGYHNEPYLQLFTAPNPGLTWEKVRIINVGIDFQIKDDRLGGSLEYYTKRGINLIGPMPVEATRGVTEYVTNYASMKGKGVDIKLASMPVKRGIVWQNSFNLSFNTDKVTEYKGFTDLPGQYYANSFSTPIVGKPLRVYHSFPSAGLDPKTGDPRGYLKGEVADFNNVVQNAKLEDLTYHGSAVPRLWGNMINTITYKSISISFNITYFFQYYIRRASIDYSQLFANWGGHSDYALRWQKPGDEAHTTVPSMPESPDQRNMFYSYSSDLMERGDHIRLQDLRLAYSVGKFNISRLNLTNATIFAYANNLGIIWRANKSGLDPDYANNTLPPARSIAFGLNIGF